MLLLLNHDTKEPRSISRQEKYLKFKINKDHMRIKVKVSRKDYPLKNEEI